MKKKEFGKKIVIVVCALVLSILIIASVWPSMFYKENEVFGLSDIGVDYTSGCIYEDGVFETISRDPQIYLPALPVDADKMTVYLSQISKSDKTPIEVQVYKYGVDSYPTEANSTVHSYVIDKSEMVDSYYNDYRQGDYVRIDIGSRVGIRYSVDHISFFELNRGVYVKSILAVGLLTIVILALFYYVCSKYGEYLSLNRLKNNKWMIVILFITLFFFSCFMYSDLAETTRHGIFFWEAIKQKKLLSYYSFNEGLLIANGNFRQYSSAMYNIAMYIVFAIWDLPLWIYEQITGLDTLMSPLGILYAKLFLVFLTIIVVKEMNKVASLLGVEEKKLIIMDLFFVSSLFYWNAVVILGQYDLLSILFMLIGFKYHLRGEKKKALLFLAIAVLFKQFAIIPIIIVVLLNQKNIGKIITTILLFLALFIMLEVIFLIIDHDARLNTVLYSTSLMQLVGSNVYPAALGYVMPGVFIVLILFLICFIFKFDMTEHPEIKMTLLAFLGFFSMCIANPYWIIIVEPFICLCIFKERNIARRNLLIITEMIMGFGYVVSAFVAAEYSYSLALVKYTWLGQIIERVKPTEGTFGEVLSVVDYMENIIPADQLQNWGVTIFIVGVVGFVALLLNKKPEILADVEFEDKKVLMVRTIFGVVFSGAIIATYLFV